MRVYTTGVFDILHRGHLNILTQAAALGELIVGVMSDRGVEETKGARPILSLEERDAQIRSLRISNGQIRFYPSGVYVCDEWHGLNGSFEAGRPT